MNSEVKFVLKFALVVALVFVIQTSAIAACVVAVHEVVCHQKGK